MLTWRNPFRKGGQFSGLRKCGGEQPDAIMRPPGPLQNFPSKEKIKGPSTVEKGHYPPFFEQTKVEVEEEDYLSKFDQPQPRKGDYPPFFEQNPA